MRMTGSRTSWSRAVTVLCTVSSLALCNAAFAQACKPVSQRSGGPGELGCWIVSADSIGVLTQSPVFWHLDTYPTPAAAAAAKGPQGTVVEALGKVWLFTIAEAGWQPAAGVRVAKIGPLEVEPGTKYIARYMESVQKPGRAAGSPHRHSGPDASYTVSGETCFETPEGKTLGRPGGDPVVIPAGRPMHFTPTGSETRRALGLILYDSSKPSGSGATEWTPKGLCTG
jgi:hypothetical protein